MVVLVSTESLLLQCCARRLLKFYSSFTTFCQSFDTTLLSIAMNELLNESTSTNHQPKKYLRAETSSKAQIGDPQSVLPFLRLSASLGCVTVILNYN